MADENLVSSPPLNTPVVDVSGRFSRAWARWFQQLYIRTSFQGGNAIDQAINQSEKNQADLIQFIAFKALFVEFQGSSTLGPVPIIGDTYNLASLERTGVGVYVATATQLTAYGYNLFDNAVVSLEFLFSASANTEVFTVKSFQVADGVFNIFVNEVTKGVGDNLVETPYDPDQPLDAIRMIISSNIGTGELPPA